MNTVKPQGHTNGGSDMLTTSSQQTRIGLSQAKPCSLIANIKLEWSSQSTSKCRPTSFVLIRTGQDTTAYCLPQLKKLKP